VEPIARAAPATGQLRRRAQTERNGIEQRIAGLTERERQVLHHDVAGRLNKQIAADPGTGEKTIKFHRGNLMRKMGVHSVAELVKLVDRAGMGTAPNG
jgi:FixJ family two-component response regulator